MSEGAPGPARPGALAAAGERSRPELPRLRKGPLDADTVVAMMEWTRGLVAPAAPADGDLIHNGTGWRVGDGGPAQRLHPRLWWWATRSGCLAGLGYTWAFLLGIPGSIVASMLLGIAPYALSIGALRLFAAVELRSLKQAPRPERLSDCPSGSKVRVAGVIAPTRTVPTLFRGQPAVLFKSVIAEVQQTQGIDFDLDLDDGQRVRISVRGALLLDRARRTREPPACGPVSVDRCERRRLALSSQLLSGPSLTARLFGGRRRYEASVAPGDRVEVCGVLHHEPAPDALGPFARQMPTRAVLRAGPRLPLLVRRLT
jgi:hypothetical protein